MTHPADFNRQLRESNWFSRLRPEPQDLLGKAIKSQEERATHYCHHCSATYSQKCRRCGERFCGNSMKNCGRDPHVCATKQATP